MALKSETKTINGNQYQVTQLPYSLGQQLLLKLYKAVGPALAKALSQAPDLENTSVADIEVRKIAPALSAAVEQLAADLSEQDFDFMVDTLGSYSYLLGEKGSKKPLTASEREFHFSGNYLELFQWIAFAIQVNYLGFLKGRDVLRESLARVKAASQSQNT